MSLGFNELIKTVNTHTNLHISMVYCKTVASPLVTQWNYCSLVLNRRYMGFMAFFFFYVLSACWNHVINIFNCHWGNHRPDTIEAIPKDMFKITRQLDSLLNSLFQRTTKKTPKFRTTGFCQGNPLVSNGFQSQWASNNESVSLLRPLMLTMVRCLYG